MKINFKSISIKNMLSYGASTINFNLNKSPFTVIVGENGSGKSSLIVDALHFSLFGKIIRKGIKLSQVINNINKKNCEVSIDFDVNGISYRIERGLAPDYLHLYKDGKMVDERASKVIVQKEIEDLLGFDQNTFKNVCILSLNNNKTFMDLTPEETRNVVENLLGIQVYSQMLDKAKEFVKENKEKLKVLIKDSDIYFRLIEENKNKINNTNKLKDEFEKNKIKQLKELLEEKKKLELEIDSLKLLIKEYDGLVIYFNEESYDESIAQVQEKIDWIDKVINEFKECYNYNDREYKFIIYKQISDEMKLLKREKEQFVFFTTVIDCPICHSVLTEEHRAIELDKIQKEIDRYEVMLDLSRRQETFYKNNLDFFSEEVMSWSDYKSKVNLEKINLNKEKLSKREVFQTLKKKAEEHKEGQIVISNDIIKTELKISSLIDKMKLIKEQKLEIVDVDKKIVEEYKWKYVEILGESEEVETELSYYEYIKEILSDGGIKAQIVKNDLPFLNKTINDYLKDFERTYTVKFDEEFNLVLGGYSKKGLSYESLSGGERKRLDLSILLAMIDLSRRKNSISCNILIFDELLSTALDSDGKKSIIDIIDRKISKGELMNVFIVSHDKDLNIENSNKIEVFKEGEFSRVKYF